MTDLNLCVLGDGLAKGVGDPQGRSWADHLAGQVVERHGPVTYYNLGIPGQSSADVAARVGELEPRLPIGSDNRLVLAFGLVDGLGHGERPPLPARESASQLARLVSVAGQSHYKLLMVGPPAVFDPVRNGRLKRLNGLFHDLCLKARVPYIDVFTSLVDDVQYRRELAKGDRIHPGAQGHIKLFDLVSNDRSWWFG